MAGSGKVLDMETKTIKSSKPWHSGLTGKLSWTQIGSMSCKLAERGRKADMRREAAMTAYRVKVGR